MNELLIFSIFIFVICCAIYRKQIANYMSGSSGNKPVQTITPSIQTPSTSTTTTPPPKSSESQTNNAINQNYVSPYGPPQIIQNYTKKSNKIKSNKMRDIISPPPPQMNIDTMTNGFIVPAPKISITDTSSPNYVSPATYLNIRLSKFDNMTDYATDLILTQKPAEYAIGDDISYPDSTAEDYANQYGMMLLSYAAYSIPFGGGLFGASTSNLFRLFGIQETAPIVIPPFKYDLIQSMISDALTQSDIDVGNSEVITALSSLINYNYIKKNLLSACIDGSCLSDPNLDVDATLQNSYLANDGKNTSIYSRVFLYEYLTKNEYMFYKLIEGTNFMNYNFIKTLCLSTTNVKVIEGLYPIYKIIMFVTILYYQELSLIDIYQTRTSGGVKFRNPWISNNLGSRSSIGSEQPLGTLIGQLQFHCTNLLLIIKKLYTLKSSELIAAYPDIATYTQKFKEYDVTMNYPFYQIQKLKKIAGIRWLENEKTYNPFSTTPTTLSTYIPNVIEYDYYGGYPYGLNNFSYREGVNFYTSKNATLSDIFKQDFNATPEMTIIPGSKIDATVFNRFAGSDKQYASETSYYCDNPENNKVKQFLIPGYNIGEPNSRKVVCYNNNDNFSELTTNFSILYQNNQDNGIGINVTSLNSTSALVIGKTENKEINIISTSVNPSIYISSLTCFISNRALTAYAESSTNIRPVIVIGNNIWMSDTSASSPNISINYRNASFNISLTNLIPIWNSVTRCTTIPANTDIKVYFILPAGITLRIAKLVLKISSFPGTCPTTPPLPTTQPPVSTTPPTISSTIQIPFTLYQPNGWTTQRGNAAPLIQIPIRTVDQGFYISSTTTTPNIFITNLTYKCYYNVTPAPVLKTYLVSRIFITNNTGAVLWTSNSTFGNHPFININNTVTTLNTQIPIYNTTNSCVFIPAGSLIYYGVSLTDGPALNINNISGSITALKSCP